MADRRSVRKTYSMSSGSSGYTLSDSSNTPSSNGPTYYWLWVMCLLGLDYFSTLAYQPSITFHETERLGPLATAAVVLRHAVRRIAGLLLSRGAFARGQGSLGMVETAHSRLARQNVRADPARLCRHRLHHAQVTVACRRRGPCAQPARRLAPGHRQDGGRLDARACHRIWRGPYFASFVNNQLVVDDGARHHHFHILVCAAQGFQPQCPHPRGAVGRDLSSS